MTSWDKGSKCCEVWNADAGQSIFHELLESWKNGCVDTYTHTSGLYVYVESLNSNTYVGGEPGRSQKPAQKGKSPDLSGPGPP